MPSRDKVRRKPIRNVLTIVFALASLNLLMLDIAQIHLALYSLNRRFPCILQKLFSMMVTPRAAWAP